jgi:glycosyltransferase involved in cell wall biosynthesis
MRVLLVSGPATGGIRRHLEALVTHLPARGVEVALAVPKTVILPPVSPRFPLHVADRPRPLSDLLAVARLRANVRSWRPEVIHAHGVKAALLALLAARQGPAVVVTLHNLWKGGPLTAILRRLLPRAAATLSVSGAVRDSFLDHRVPLRDPQVVPHGIDPALFPVIAFEPGERHFCAAFAGRLTEEKGVRVLLEAARRLNQTAPQLVFIVIGDGPLRGV